MGLKASLPGVRIGFVSAPFEDLAAGADRQSVMSGGRVVVEGFGLQVHIEARLGVAQRKGRLIDDLVFFNHYYYKGIISSRLSAVTLRAS